MNFFYLIDHLANKILGKSTFNKRMEADRSLSNEDWIVKYLQNTDNYEKYKNFLYNYDGSASDLVIKKRKKWESEDPYTPYRHMTIITLLGFLLLLILIIISFILYIPGVIVAMIMNRRYRNKHMKDKHEDLSKIINEYIANGKYSWLYVWRQIRS